ncbi:MAG: hypothetical protein IJ083_16135 [Clostridia bacterium]|nr:hypothetical protein [Clostridia bacterium]
MSQTHAASLLGCSNTMLCLYESAKRPIPWVIITRMVAVYHINPAALFTAQASEHTYPEFVEQFQAKSYAFFDMIVQMLAQAREEGAKEALAAHGIS